MSYTKEDYANMHNWSRHYDVMQATVCTLLLGSSAAIYAHLNSKETPHYSIHLTIGAVILILCSLYAATSFRSFRNAAQRNLPEADKSYLVNNSPIKQWHVNWTIHLLFLLVWLRKIYVVQKNEHHFYVYLTISLLVVGTVLLYLFVQEHTRTDKQQQLLIRGDITLNSSKALVISGSSFVQSSDVMFRTNENVVIEIKGPIEIRGTKPPDA